MPIDLVTPALDALALVGWLVASWIIFELLVEALHALIERAHRTSMRHVIRRMALRIWSRYGPPRSPGASETEAEPEQDAS